MCFYFAFLIIPSVFVKFDNIKVVEAQNNEALVSGKMDLKELLKQKQSLEIRIQSLYSMVTRDNTTQSLSNAFSIDLLTLLIKGSGVYLKDMSAWYPVTSHVFWDLKKNPHKFYWR